MVAQDMAPVAATVALPGGASAWPALAAAKCAAPAADTQGLRRYRRGGRQGRTLRSRATDRCRVVKTNTTMPPPVDAATKDAAAFETEDQASTAATSSDELQVAEAPPQARHVHFSEAPDEEIQVQAYCEIYGLHPNEFVFDKNHYMVPTGGQYGFTDLLAAAETVKSLEVDESASNWDIDSESDDDEWSEVFELRFV
mmetsp:Transcript_34532/g.99160  ORF Transcript_34532/g.99160 Transcript_34532/m.99160 type:complete len:198 (-) Transcript_34532:165-758(-)